MKIYDVSVIPHVATDKEMLSEQRVDHDDVQEQSFFQLYDPTTEKYLCVDDDSKYCWAEESWYCFLNENMEPTFKINMTTIINFTTHNKGCIIVPVKSYRYSDGSSFIERDFTKAFLYDDYLVEIKQSEMIMGIDPANNVDEGVIYCPHMPIIQKSSWGKKDTE